MKRLIYYNKPIAFILIFALAFPLLSGFIFASPAYAVDRITENRGIMSMIKGLLMVFFFSFLSNRDETEAINDSYESAAQEESASPPSTSYQRIDTTQKERDILARTVYSEARGEPYKGQVAVAAVVINRVLDSEFPNDVEGVVFERPGGTSYAFSAVLDGQIHLTPDQTAYRAVEEALNGWDPSDNSLYYYNPVTATATWIFENTVGRKKIGNHLFADLKR